MKLTTRVLVVLVAVMALVTTGSVAYSMNVQNWDNSREVASQALFKGGPIRVGPSLYPHGNATHAVVGVEKVSEVNCRLVLDLEWHEGERVMAAVVEEDETISKLGIQAGLSGGGHKGTISFWKDGRRVCPSDKRFGTASNVWVSIVTIDTQDN